MFHDKSMHRNPIFFTLKEFYRYFQTKRLVPGLASAKETIYGKSRHFVYVRALIMCKSKDAVIASYQWAVLHTPVDTRAMHYVSLITPIVCISYFSLRERGEARLRKERLQRRSCRCFSVACKARTFGSHGSHVWLAHWQYSPTNRRQPTKLFWRCHRDFALIG